MNYLLQLRAFKKQRLIKPLTSSAVLLYFILLEFSNDIGFPKSFTITNSALGVYSCLSMQSILRGRSRLVEYGYITYIPGSGVQCGTYSLTDLTVNYDTHRDKQSDIQPQSGTPYDTPCDNPSDNPSDTLSDKQVALETITLTKQNSNKTKQNKKDSLCEKENLVFFDAFWKVYPKKQAKSEALKAFLKLSPDKELLDRMLDAIALFSRSAGWKHQNGRYIPLPSSWLNGKRWEDEAITINKTAMSEVKKGCPY